MARPGVGVGVVVFRDSRAAEVLLVRRGKAPAQGLWAPPGGSIEWGETVAEAAAREVHEETGLRVHVPDQATFASIDVLEQDERRTLAFHFVLVEVVAFCEEDAEPVAADDADDCRWWPVTALHEAQPQVADLPQIVEMARTWLSTARKALRP